MNFDNPSWADLRTAGNSVAVKLSALFPAVGYLILFNDEIARFLSSVHLDRAAPTSGYISLIWINRLYFMYFGFMAVGLGALAYAWTCPFIVKKYGDANDYIRNDGASYSRSAIRQLATVLMMDYPAGPMNEELYELYKPDVLRNWYADQSRGQPRARFCVATLYLTGFLLLSIPSAICLIKIIGLIIV